jgi:hypothetical protein
MNNVVGVRPITYYLGYVPAVPEFVAFVLKGLPFVTQAVLYRVLPFGVVFVLYREWRLLLARDGARADAALLTIASLVIVRVVEAHIWGNLMLVIWPMFLAAVLHAIRIARESRPLGVGAMAGIFLAALSIPCGILLAPLLLMQVRPGGDRRRNVERIVLAVAIAGGYAWLNAHFLATSVVFGNPLEIAAAFRRGFATDYRLFNTIAAVASLTLTAALILAWRRRRGTDDIMVAASLASVGLITVAAYLVSDRLPFNDGGFGGVHILPALMAMLIVISRAILRIDDAARRAVLVGVFAGVAAASVGREIYMHLRGPAITAISKYRFLGDAEAFRQSCTDGERLIFEDEDDSPVVLCRPQRFEYGLHEQTNFTPVVGAYDTDAEPREHPFIYNGQPLF